MSKMRVKELDQYTKQYTINALTVEVRTSDQHCTIYDGDRPKGTLIRRRHNERGPEWTVYNTNGQALLEANYILPLLRRLERALAV